MTDARLPIPHALRWHEGMLLAPQHFQQQSTRFESMLHYYAGVSAPFFWGIVDIEIDEAMLDHRVFRVANIQAIMPDGLYVSAPPEPLDLTPHKAEAEKAPLRIHLCVPQASVAERQGVMARFVVGSADAVADEDPDADEGQLAVTVPRLLPNATLAAIQTGAGGVIRLPLAEVEYVDSQFRLTEYVPPHFKTSDADWCKPVYERCKEVARKVRGKANYLLEMIQSPVGSANRPRFERQLNSLVGALPEFETHLESNEVHPYVLYTSLCTLSAHVATVGTVDEIPRYPRYDHHNISELFESVSGSLFNAIDLGVQENFTEYRFEGQGHEFTLPFEEDWVGRKLVLGFLGTPPQEMAVWAESCYIGTDQHIDSMTRNRDIGAGRARDDAHEGLRRRPGTLLFTLDDALRRVEPGETLHIYNPVAGDNDPAPTRVVMYVKHASED